MSAAVRPMSSDGGPSGRSFVVVFGSLGLAALVSLFAVPLMMVFSILGASASTGLDCGPLNRSAIARALELPELSMRQRENALTVYAVGRRLRLPDRALVVALAVAHQESNFLNYANDGQGADLAPAQMGVTASLDYPHDAVGSDHGSLGVFQQQWPGWGTVAELMDPAWSARRFYRALISVPGWRRMAIADAGQAVQRSAFPDAYADDEPIARQILESVESGLTRAGSTDPGSGCLISQTGAGSVVYPVADGSTLDEHNFGARSSAWARFHTGTDFAAPCGQPVFAATGGIVVVSTSDPWSGRWLVKVSTGTGRLTTWYGHMRSLRVRQGEEVRAGQQLGEVGDLGNASGCHLHFEVHPNGGSIYADPVNPSLWLADHVGGGSHARSTGSSPLGGDPTDEP